METDVPIAIVMFLVAFAYANVGLGGGLLYFPILSYFYKEWEPSTIVALTLLFSIATLASSARNHYKEGFVHVRYVMILAVPMAASAFGGAHYTLRSSRAEIKILFSLVLLGIAIKMILDTSRDSKTVSGEVRERAIGRNLSMAAIAACAGFLSGSVGIGGGVIATPLLIYLARLETRKAVGTTSLALLITASCGFLTYLTFQGVHAPPSLAGIFLLSTFAGGTIGSRYGLRKLKSKEVRILFVLLLILAAIWTGIVAIG